MPKEVKELNAPVKPKRTLDVEGGCVVLAGVAAVAFTGLLLYVAVLGTVWLTRTVF